MVIRGNFLRKYSLGYKNHTFGNNPPPPSSQWGLLDSTGQRHCSSFCRKECVFQIWKKSVKIVTFRVQILVRTFFEKPLLTSSGDLDRECSFHGPGYIYLLPWWLSGNSLIITKVGVVSSVSAEHYECFQWYSIRQSTASALACTDLTLSNVLIVTTEAHFASTVDIERCVESPCCIPQLTSYTCALVLICSS